MAGLTWLHFSDWHQRGEDFDRRVVRDALIQDIRERACISPDLAQVDFIVFSGDVAYAGKAKEYSTAIEHLFAPVLEAAGLSHNRLFIVPGNHDLDRDAFKYLFGALKQPLTSNSEVQEWFTDPEGITNLLRPFKEYDNFIAEHVDQSQTAYAYLRQFKAGGKCIALIGLNSALLSGRHNEVRDGREVINDDRYLILGEPQIYDLLHNEDFCKADVRIAVMHHPFDWLIKFDRDLVCDRLREACHFVLQGHEHQPRVNIELGPGGDCVIIPAGPSYDRREPEISRCANAYNYVHLDFVTGKGRVYLRRYEDRQGWIKDTATTGDESPGLYTFDLPKDLGKKKEPASMVLETDKPPSGHEQPDSSQEQEQVGRKKLRKDYMEAVRKRYRLLELRGLAPQAAEGAADPALSEVYVPLSLIEGLESQQTFEARKPVRDAQPADTLEDQPEMPEPADEMYSEGEGQIEYVPTRPEKAMREAPGRIVDMWDGLASGPSDQIAILGEAGAGKTTTVRYLALALAGEPGTKADARFAGYLPIIGRLAKYSRRLMEGEPGLSLKRHLCEDPFDRSDFGPLLEQELGAGRCVVILDGLDEASCLREVAEAVQDFTAGYGKNHIVITSRIDAYRQTRLGGFRPLTIRRMEEFEYICQFIDRWYEGRSCDEQPGAQDLKDALYERPKLMELVKNPLMLTIIIHMHWRTTTLPGSSIEVYRATTDTLIKYWRESKYGDDPQSKVGLENLYQDTVRQILKPIAYHMLNGNGLIGEDELVDMLTTGIIEVIGWDEVRAREGSRRWLKLISEESGLLASQGTDRQGKRVFEFMHRRFAEYLAAGYLAERWHADDREFVLNHVHKPQWIEVIELFVAQVGYDSKVVATKVLQVILGLGSPWEGIVWRDRILAGKCLGEGVLVGGEMRGVILRNLVSLLLSRQSGLRAEAVRIFAGLQGTQYQQAGIEHVRALLENERPWAIEVAIAETLLRLGERERSRELLLTLREAASRRGHSSTMARIIELLLEKWKEKTIAWLIDVARKYEGRGLALEVNADPTETTVAATDESFGSVHVGRHLTKAELGTFIDRLTEVLVLPEQQEMAQWVRYRLDESASEIRRLATQGHVERVRRLAAEWLIEYHDEREAGVHVLAELATQGEDSLRAIIALRQLEERESVIRGAWTILAKTLDAANEQVAAMLLAEQGEEEEIEAATVSVELLLSQELNDRQTYHLAETLLNMAGPAHKIGLAALRAIAMSVRHTYRYEAAVAIGKAGKEDKIDEIIDEAYQTLLDIAERWGVLDRVNAILALNDTLYATRRKRDQVDLTLLAGRVVNEVSDKYNALTRLLGARIVPPEESCEIQAVPNHGPKTTRAKWEERAQEAWGRFRRVSEEWLDALPEQSQAHPYRQAAKAYLLAEKGQTDDAICVLQEAAMHPGASARLLRRVSKRLLKLPAREDGLKALGRIPAQSANETLGWLEMAYLLRSSDETDQALEATRKVATVATEFWIRREAALLLNQLGQTDDGKELLFRGIEAEVPGRTDWLLGLEVSRFREMLLDLVARLIERDPEFVYARTTRAETLRRLRRYDEALKAVETAIGIDGRHSWAWGVKSEILQNMGQREKAIAALNRATELSPDYRWAWAFKAETHRQIGQYDDALASVERALELDEQYTWAWRVKGGTLENMGRREEAITALNRATELNPDNSWTWAFRAETLRRLGQYKEALEEVENALKIDKSYGFAWRVKSEALASMDRYDEALAMLIEALGNDDKSTKLSAIGALARIGDAEAVEPLLVALKDPESEVRTAAASALGELGDQRATKGLIEALDDADGKVRAAAIDALPEPKEANTRDVLVAALKDSESEVRSSAAYALRSIADEYILEELAATALQDEEMAENVALALVLASNDAALGILKQMVAKWPHKMTLYALLGISLQRLGRLDEAIDAHNKAITEEPLESLHYLARGATYLAEAQYEASAADARQAIALAPDWAQSWSSLGCALFELGQHNEALQAWWRAKSVTEHGNAELGIGLWTTGNRDEALRLWRRAATRKPKLGQDWDWMRREQVWGPRMIEVTQEIVAALGMQ